MTKTSIKKISKPTPAKKSNKAKARSSAGGGGGAGQSSADRIMNAIASRYAFGDAKPDRKMIMILAAMTNEKSYATTLLNMKKQQKWIEYDKTSVWFTSEGKDHVGSDAIVAPQNNDLMHAKIREDMIKIGKSREIFDLMTDGAWYSKEELAEKMNMPLNKSFGTYTSGLSKVTEKANGKMRLLDIAFPVGRPCDSN